VPTIEQRYAAVAALTQVAHLAGQLARISDHGGSSKRKMAELSQRHIATAFRAGGDDASIAAVLKGLSGVIGTVVRGDRRSDEHDRRR
jgi:hypothetical protein